MLTDSWTDFYTGEEVTAPHSHRVSWDDSHYAGTGENIPCSDARCDAVTVERTYSSNPRNQGEAEYTWKE